MSINESLQVLRGLEDFGGKKVIDCVVHKVRDDPTLRGIALVGQFGAGKTYISDELARYFNAFRSSKKRNIHRLFLDNSIAGAKQDNPDGFDGPLRGADQFEYVSQIRYYSDIVDYCETVIERQDPTGIFVFEAGVGQRDEGNSTIRQLESNYGMHLLILGIVADPRNLLNEVNFRRAVRAASPEEIPELLMRFSRRLDDQYDPRDPEVAERVIKVVSRMARPEVIEQDNEEVIFQSQEWGLHKPSYLEARSREIYVPGEYLEHSRLRQEQLLKGAHMEYHLDLLGGADERGFASETIAAWNVFRPNRIARLNIDTDYHQFTK